jgi:hypothetical protein
MVVDSLSSPSSVEAGFDPSRFVPPPTQALFRDGFQQAALQTANIAGTGTAARTAAAAQPAARDANTQELVSKVSALCQQRYGALNATTMHKLFNDYANSKGLVDANGLNRLLSDAGVGNLLTRGLWTDGIMKHFDPPNAAGQRVGGISWDAFSRGLK